MGRGSRGANGKLVGAGTRGTRAAKAAERAEEVSISESGVDNIRLREKKAAVHADQNIFDMNFKGNIPLYKKQVGRFTFEGQAKPVTEASLKHASQIAESKIKEKLIEKEEFGIEDVAEELYSGLGYYYLVSADKDSDFYEFQDYNNIGEENKKIYRTMAEKMLDKGIDDLNTKIMSGEFLPSGVHPFRDLTVNEGIKLNSRRLRAERTQAKKLGYDSLEVVPTKHPDELTVSRAGQDVLKDREKKVLRKYLDLIRSQEKEEAALTALRSARNS